MFSHVSVHPSICLSTGGVLQPDLSGGGGPQGTPAGREVPHLARGYPTLGTPHQTWLGGGTLPGGGIPPDGGTPPQVPPCQIWLGGTPARGNRWSTWYAAVGMSLAFTQENFFVL